MFDMTTGCDVKINFVSVWRGLAPCAPPPGLLNGWQRHRLLIDTPPKREYGNATFLRTGFVTGQKL